MNDQMKQARERYESTELPPELPFRVAQAVRTGEKRRTRRKALRRTLTTAVAACACFVLMLNVNPSFASAVSEVPVLGQIARIFTATEYSISDKENLIDVRLPALADTGHTDLEERINTEIQTRVNAVIEAAQQRADEAKKAFVQTGGVEEEFIPVIIDVNYEIKCQNDQYLSFVVTETETQANAHSVFYTYNIDLKTGKELTLSDLLGSDWKALANTAVRAGIAERSKDPDNFFFDGSEGVEGFQSIRGDQQFYLNAAGNPVVIFEKYEIAPGYMGAQEFEIAR